MRLTISQKRSAFRGVDNRRLILWLGLPAAGCLIIQFALGASPWVILLAASIVATGLAGFAFTGVYSVASWLALFYVLGNVLVPVYAKTAMGQSLDSHLYSPLDSFLVLAVCSAELLIALILAKQVPVGKRLLRATADPRSLRWLSWGSFFLGLAFWFANFRFQGPGGSGFGGIAAFRDLVFMAIIARTALVLETSDNRRTIDFVVVIMIAAAILLGLLTNSKTYAALPVVSYFATLFFYLRRIPARHIAALIIGSAIFLTIFTPLIQAWRYLGQQQMPLERRISLMESTMTSIIEGHQFEYYVHLEKIQFQGGYYDYFGGNGRGQVVLGRYASVQQIDPVINEINRQGTLGGDAIWPDLTILLPKVVYPAKPEYPVAYHLLVDLGLINPNGGKYPTVPLAGQAYAGYGAFGVLVIPFLTFLGFLLALKKIGWNLYRNVYAIFFLCDFMIVYAGQGALGQYAGAVLRNFPLFMIIFFVLGKLGVIGVRRPRVYWQKISSPRAVHLVLFGRPVGSSRSKRECR